MLGAAFAVVVLWAKQAHAEDFYKDKHKLYVTPPDVIATVKDLLPNEK